MGEWEMLFIRCYDGNITIKNKLVRRVACREKK
jgi:hypothetical protein